MIIDSFGAIPDPEIIGSWFEAFRSFDGYRRMFAKTFARLAGLSPDDLSHVDAVRHLERLQGLWMPIDDYVAALDLLGVRSVGVWVHVSARGGRTSLDRLAEIVDQYPRRFLPLPSYDRSLPDLRQRVERDHERLGLAGVTVLPIVDDRPADHDDNRWLYDWLSERGLVAWIHTVNTWSERHPSDYSHPRRADRVACAFPNLKIVLGHGGWPWVGEAVAIAWRHPNVYIEPSAFRWKTLAEPGAGWEPLLHHGDRTIADKVLFGSLWPNLGQSLAQVLDEARSLPLKPANLARWLGGNAARLFALADANHAP